MFTILHTFCFVTFNYTLAGASAVERNGEVYGDCDEDGVRAPIPQTQETLVEAGYEGYEMQNRRQTSRAVRVRSVFDGFR